MPSSKANLEAWAAGLFEGEGSLTWRKQRTRKGVLSGVLYPSAQLNSTDEDVIRKYHGVVGIGHVSGPFFREGRKPIWLWRAMGRESMEAVERMFGPHLCKRRSDKLAEMLTYFPTRRGTTRHVTAEARRQCEERMNAELVPAPA